MIKLSKKDWKILGQLDINVRQPYSEIAKKVGLSKEVVRYRIKNMEDKKIIKGYRFYLNTKILGYEAFKWFIQLQNLDEKTMEQLITELKVHPYVAWISTLTGRWDLGVAFLVESPQHFEKVVNHFLLKYSTQIRESAFTIELDIIHFKRKGLFKKRNTREKILYFGGEKKRLALKEKEVLILNELVENANISLVDIYKKTGLSVDIIRYYMTKLEKEGIIQGSEIDFNYDKIGVEWHKIFLNRKKIDEQKEQQFLSFLKSHPNVLEILFCLGQWNAELNVEVNNGTELYKLLMEMKTKFPEIILSYDTAKISQNYKYNMFPMGEELLKKLT